MARGVVLAGMALLAIPANAGSLGGHLAGTTDYVFRGVSQTRGAPAVQGDVHYQNDDGWFAGIWVSSVDLNPGKGATQELNLYGGRGWPLSGDWNARVTVVDYVYPNDGATFSYDYVEVIGSIAWLDRIVASVAWSPNTSRFANLYGGGVVEDRTAWTYELVGQWPLKGGLSATGSVGYYDLSDLFHFGYTYASAGLSYKHESLQLDGGYFLTEQEAREQFGREVAGNRWSLSVSWRFP
jgi:uncharacterized protein (TIGR02001 family)